MSKVSRPTEHIIGHIGDGFLWIKWPNQHITVKTSGVSRCTCSLKSLLPLLRVNHKLIIRLLASQHSRQLNSVTSDMASRYHVLKKLLLLLILLLWQQFITNHRTFQQQITLEANAESSSSARIRNPTSPSCPNFFDLSKQMDARLMYVTNGMAQPWPQTGFTGTNLTSILTNTTATNLAANNWLLPISTRLTQLQFNIKSARKHHLEQSNKH